MRALLRNRWFLLFLMVAGLSAVPMIRNACLGYYRLPEWLRLGQEATGSAQAIQPSQSRRLAGAGVQPGTRDAEPAAPQPPEKPRSVARLELRPGGRVHHLAFLGGGTELITASDQAVQVWAAGTGTLNQEHRGLVKASVLSRVVAPTGKHLAFWDYAKVEVVDLQRNTTIEVPSVNGASVRALAFSGAGDLLAIGVDNGVLMWEVATMNSRRNLLVPVGRLQALAGSPDNHTLAVVGGNQGVLVDFQTGGSARELVGGKEMLGVSCLRFSADGNLLVAAAFDGLRVWRADTGHLEASLGGGGAVIEGVVGITGCAFSPTDNHLLACAAPVRGEDAITFWDLPRRQSRGTIAPGLSGMKHVAFSPDGKTLAAAGYPNTPGSAGQVVRLWEVDRFLTKGQ